MQPFRPEGQYAAPPSPEALRKSMGTGEIFQAMCTKCDEFHDLHVDLGPISGRIPRQEVALGLSDGRTKEYAILSRVGKPVSFQVLDFDRNGAAILSRRAAQSEVRSYLLSALSPGDVLPAVVQNPTSMGLFCDVGCGFTALMPIERCCISRLSTTALRWRPGQEIYAALLDADDLTGRITLTGKELLGTWEENAARFRPGQVVQGFVRSVMPYGVFVELAPNLSGLSEPDERVQSGDAVSVFIRAIQPEKHKIKLNILDVLPSQIPADTTYFTTHGHIASWEYYPGSPNFTRF